MTTRAPYVAALRVYEPLERFSEDEKDTWKSFLNCSDTTSDTRQQEKTLALRRMILTQSPVGLQDGVHVLKVDGGIFAAPWTTRTRCLISIQELKASLPAPVVRFFIPVELEEAINLELEKLIDRVPHILSSNWMIPPRWFALFTAEEKKIWMDSEGIRLVYRTGIELARKRATRARRAARKAFGPGPVEEELVEMTNWLGVFDSKSIVELDYGGLASILDRCLLVSGEGGISADSSVEDVHRSIEGLLQGDPTIAGSGYERLMARWRRVSELETAT